MNYILDFYKGLDTVNLIIFWGVIIVVLLLLIFSIIIANKNRKLEKIIESNGINIDDDNFEGLPIKNHKDLSNDEKKQSKNNNDFFFTEEEQQKMQPNEEKKEIISNISTIKDEEIPIIEPEKNTPEEKFIAEEHVMEYIEDYSKSNDNNIQSKNEEKKYQEEPKVMPGAYQKNILREVYPSQTSPIGIIKRDIKIEEEQKNEKELNELLDNKTNEIKNDKEKIVINDIKSETTSYVDKERYKYHVPERKYQETYKKGNYLEELSKKLAENNNKNEINRTAYELKQEEDAIISYEELMQKKDSIQIVDEEDAIISIEELKKRKENEEKLYNITEKENDNDFINELKNFRSDL